MGCEVEGLSENVAVAAWKYLKILAFQRFLSRVKGMAGC